MLDLIVSTSIEHLCAIVIGTALLSGFVGFWLVFFIGSGDE